MKSTVNLNLTFSFFDPGAPSEQQNLRLDSVGKDDDLAFRAFPSAKVVLLTGGQRGELTGAPSGVTIRVCGFQDGLQPPLPGEHG